jgi:hypothetical protein
MTPYLCMLAFILGFALSLLAYVAWTGGER